VKILSSRSRTPLALAAPRTCPGAAVSTNPLADGWPLAVPVVRRKRTCGHVIGMWRRRQSRRRGPAWRRGVNETTILRVAWEQAQASPRTLIVSSYASARAISATSQLLGTMNKSRAAVSRMNREVGSL